MSHQLSLPANFSHKTNLNFALQAYKFGKLTSTQEIFSRHPKANLQFFTVNRNTGTQFHCKLDLPLISLFLIIITFKFSRYVAVFPII